MTAECNRLHLLCSKLKRFQVPFEIKETPKNGIYLVFENGENAHNQERIVRIGSHTGKDQLQSRILQHFINENKDRSIFRKNIGRALLKKENDRFLAQWELDLTTKKAKAQWQGKIDQEKQKQIEKQVTTYLQKKCSFVVIEIPEKAERLELESKLISTISNCQECKPSKEWLGQYSPKEKIRESGLWIVNELYKTPLNQADLAFLEKKVNEPELF